MDVPFIFSRAIGSSRPVVLGYSVADQRSALDTLADDLHLSDAQFDLIEGSYDLALRNSVLEDSTLTARKLADDQRVLCASPHYLERYGTPKTAADLEKHRLIGFRNMDAKVLTETNDCTAVFDPKRGTQKLVVNDGSTQRRLTREGAGISVNSAWLVHNDLADGSLIRLLPNYEFVDKPSLWLIYPKSNVVSAKVRVFIDYLIEHIGRPKMWGILN